MATLKQIRKRLSGVRNTQKITRAMKLVAAAKLRRAQENMLKAKPYANRMRDLIWDLSERTSPEAHPLLQVREEKNVMMLVVTSDRGLCGAFNANINRRAERRLKSCPDGINMKLALIGRKGRDYFRRRGYPIEAEYMEVLTDPTFNRISEIGSELVAKYLDGRLDAVYLVYNEFKSALSQQVVVERLLPIIPERDQTVDENGVAVVSARQSQELAGEFKFEPSMETVLNTVLPMYFNVRLYFAVLESLAAEMGARMTAMESATQNANELISRLNLLYNKARQAAITTEMLEIVSGAEAMK
ncbi:MAG TPA: ATP synthase F1 subunit gamma [Myxococcota bacterium]|nr:ATP synthase F1 subunit gamma [Myxococcota bacterium]HQP95138.1 ATP synthase F1 subunit gamma [Myxococcota bacterium]